MPESSTVDKAEPLPAHSLAFSAYTAPQCLVCGEELYRDEDGICKECRARAREEWAETEREVLGDRECRG